MKSLHKFLYIFKINESRFMKKYNLHQQLVFILLSFVLSTVSFAQSNNNVFQYSVISALQEGIYDGSLTINEVSKHGDFGLGTLNHLDGELVLLDGKFYQITGKGDVRIIPGETLTPFAVVTFFNADESRDISDPLSYKELQSSLDGMIPGLNTVYAIKIEGTFSYMKTRSINAQQKPYKKLVEVTKGQSVFEFEDIEGTIVGFRFPSYTEGVNVPGYHFHFISADKKSGGHVLDLKISDVEAETARQNNLNISFPGNEEFLKADLSGKNSLDLNEAEK
jgi:acetolactate decarboxylase